MEQTGNIAKRFIILCNAPCHRGIESRLLGSIPTNTDPSARGLDNGSEGKTWVGARRHFLLDYCPGALGEITAATILSSYLHVLTLTVG